ncbi:TRAP transporter permease [Actinokineospora xionganensis]|uniref:TRAP transporter fused permease subunit n=1 Tax=Actinokineospora xionganensis TaxID=2684470 RepID=A0ABR7L250_9PSEU|nr:TRAP transporter fused permease subunit [Actinokineospora xionganensis]MBC6446745.1 TRAP transporter fused permease subunit [Actinokineospora xionganensis]
MTSTIGPTEVVGAHDEERPARRLTGRWDLVVWAASVAIAVLVLEQVFWPFPQGGQFYLVIFLGLTLPLVFLCYRPRSKSPQNPGFVDWVYATIALFVGLYPVLPFGGNGFAGGYDAFLDRAGQLSTPDILAGGLLLVLILEATRRTTGWVLPIVCLGFLAFAYYGGFLPQNWDFAHAGIDFGQIVNALYNEQSGFYGIPLNVAATYIVLFTIYGAVLNTSGAGGFFVDFSFALFRRSRTAAGRTAATSGFLLGTVSGSGTATTVSLGAITWPVLREAGYPKENAGGLLAASGIGAILSPPTLGAAAFIIAEYLQTSYLSVLVWAIVPTLLYYLGIGLAVEADARRFHVNDTGLDLATALPPGDGPWPVYRGGVSERPLPGVAVDSPPRLWTVLRQGWFHFASLGIIVVFLAMDIPPFTAVVYATGVAALFALIPRRGNLRGWVRDLADSLAEGVRGALPVIAVCAAAGIITSTITKTGLGLALADALVSAAKSLASDPTAVLVLTVVFAAVAVCVLGLAVPVTASFIISWVVLGPALINLGVAPAETAMFIFYYAVLSEVTPPTALAAVAAAAITGGSVMGTMWQTWKYTLPAFLLPIAFVLTDNGAALLLQRPVGTVLWVVAVSAVGIGALAVVTGGWLFGPVRLPVRLLCVPAALLLLYLHPLSIGIGLGFLVLALAVHLITRVKEKAHA